MAIVNHEYLFQFAKNIFSKIGCNNEDASLASEVLNSADLRGIDSHGIARLSGYIRLWQKGRINTSPHIKIVHQSPSTLNIDGDAGLGLVVAAKAMDMVIEKCKNTGTAWAAIHNSNHFGIAAYHASKVLKHNMIGYASTNASPLVSPTYSKERLLGTNPICYAIPGGKFNPIIIDMATSAAANGKLEIAQRNNEQIPEGWIIKNDGSTTTDPHALKAQGSLLPLGSKKETGSHKGYCMGSMVDIFSGVLSGANFGPWVPPFVSFLDVEPNLPGKGLGHFIGAWQIEAFSPIEQFNKNIEQWIARFKNAEPISPNNPVVIPGEPEFNFEIERKTHGIPLNDNVILDLISLGKSMDIPFEIA